MPIRFVCVVSRDDRPVFFAAAPGVGEGEVPGLLTVVFASLDAIEERTGATRRGAVYLGEVLLFEELRVFALVTGTAAKIVLLGDDRDVDSAKEIASAVHRRLVEALQSPFQPPHADIPSTRLRTQVLHLLGRTGS